MSLTHTNINSVITSQNPVTPPHCYDSLHLFISLERAFLLNQNLGLNGWPWARNEECHGKIGRNWFLNSKVSAAIPRDHIHSATLSSFPRFQEGGFCQWGLMVSHSSSSWHYIPLLMPHAYLSPQEQLHFLLWAPPVSVCSLQPPVDGWVQQGAFSALCSQGTFFRSVLTFLFHPSDWFFLPLSTRYFSQTLSSSKQSSSWQWPWTHLPTFSSAWALL